MSNRGQGGVQDYRVEPSSESVEFWWPDMPVSITDREALALLALSAPHTTALKRPHNTLGLYERDGTATSVDDARAMLEGSEVTTSDDAEEWVRGAANGRYKTPVLDLVAALLPRDDHDTEGTDLAGQITVPGDASLTDMVAGLTTARRRMLALGAALPPPPADAAASDIGEGVRIARIAYTAGIVDEPTAWRLIRICAEQAATRYRSWHDYGAAYLFAFATTDAVKYLTASDPTSCDGTIVTLLHMFSAIFTAPDSPWRLLPFPARERGHQ